MAPTALRSSTPSQEYIDDYSAIRDRIADVYPAIYADFNSRIKAPPGFHLEVPPRRRIWATPDGKADFLPLPGLEVNDPVDDPQMLPLSAIRCTTSSTPRSTAKTTSIAASTTTAWCCS
ncbi:hypothetical protein [Paracoccus aminovorans]|uniref:hypothetical protein n=1 Tax=Paracoccus aminovorans TaxID=34004 RepID=UPI000941E539|nr:hypothetical protein [Paracoccus aminovorans]